MSAVKYARWPAATILLVWLLFAAAYAASTRGRATQDEGPGTNAVASADRRRSVVFDGEDSRALFASAERLRAEAEYRLAADAYQRVLAKEPYHREAQFWAAICLAEAGLAPAVENYMEKLTSGDARLAVEVFQRRELAPHMSSPRMSALLEQATDQARD